MSDKEIKPNSVSFGKLFLIFLLIFTFALLYISFRTSVKLVEENEKQIESYMASKLDSFVDYSSEEGYVWIIFNKIKEAAITKGLESQELSKNISDCNLKYNITANFFFYKNNEFAKAFNHKDEDLYIFTDMLKYINYEKDDPRFIEANRKTHLKLQEYFGAGNRIEIISLAKKLLRSFYINEIKQFYYVDDNPNGIGVFFYTIKIPDFIERLKVILADNPNDYIGAIDSSNNKIIPPKNLTEDQTHSAYLKTIKSSKAFIEANGYYWYFQTTINSNKICYAIPTNLNITNFFNWAGLLEIVSIILCFVILVIYLTSLIKIKPGINIVDILDNLSIKYRIIGILSISSIFPALMSLVFGFSLLSDKERVLEEAIFSESLAGISNIENQYKELRKKVFKLALEFREVVKHEKMTKELFNKYLEKYSLDPGLTYLELRDEKINSLYSMFDRQTSGVAETMDLIGRIVLKIHNPGRLDSSKLNITPAELVSETVFSTDELGFNTLLGQRGKQWVLRSGSHPTMWYWDIYPELASGPAFICFTSQTITSFKRQIIEYFDNLHLSSDSLQLYTYICDSWYYPKIQPDSYNYLPEKELINIAESAFKTNKVLFRTVNINGKDYWVTAKEEKNVRSHVFLHLINKEERLKVLNPYKWQLVIGGIFTMVISLLGAWFVISLVILPVNDLTKGIEAIRFRYKDFNIPVRRKDEFGKLATAFNHVLASLSDLEQGKIVQESLLPASAPEVPGYDIAFFTVSASDLAGDYHDYVTLDDGRISIILGDVSGHGISASLAMAMAKASFNYAKSIKAKFPEELMDMLNTIFNKELKPRNKLMTLLSIVLTPETGEVIFDNSGQSYPAYYTAETKTSEELKMPSLPLGGMKKRKKKPVIKNMQPGDAFIFYTDGIIEASSEKGEMFGYERFFAKFTEQMKNNVSSKEAINNIYQAVEDFREPGHHSDDITMIIVKRIPILLGHKVENEKIIC